MRAELDGAVEERDRITQEYTEINKYKTELERERKQLRSELKEIKSRETRNLLEYSELEEENITLQKQVSGLKSSQVILCTFFVKAIMP